MHAGRMPGKEDDSMPHHSRALAVLLLALPLATGCSHSSRVAAEPWNVFDQPVTTQPTVVTTQPATVTTRTTLVPIAGHAPVTTSGTVSSFDPATGILTFRDGRMVKLTDQTRVLQPADTRTVRTGEQVIVQNALPVGVSSSSIPSLTGKRQRMATVAEVDASSQIVRLTDGTVVRVVPSTRMHMGTAGRTVTLTDLRPGDELVIVMADLSSRTTSSTASPRGGDIAQRAAKI